MGEDQKTQPIILYFGYLSADLQEQIKSVSMKKSAPCAPVYPVEHYTNSSASTRRSFGFSTFVTETHAHAYFESGRIRHFELKVNDRTFAVSYNYSETSGGQPAVISALLPLKADDKVGIFAFRGELYASIKTKIV